MSGDQITRDELLKQRLWAATQDCEAVCELLADLTKNPPPSGTDQEQRVRDIESGLYGLRWNCARLKELR